MFSHVIWRPQLATATIAASTFASASTSDEVLLFDEDILVSQAYYSNTPIFAFDSSSVVALKHCSGYNNVSLLRHKQHTMSKLSRAIKFTFAIWVAALLLALPQAMQFSVVSELGGTSCTIGNHFVEHVFAVSGFIFFGGPMTAICLLYVLIGIKLKRSRLLQAVPRRSLDEHRGSSAQSRVIRMLGK